MLVSGVGPTTFEQTEREAEAVYLWRESDPESDAPAERPNCPQCLSRPGVSPNANAAGNSSCVHSMCQVSLTSYPNAIRFRMNRTLQALLPCALLTFACTDDPAGSPSDLSVTRVSGNNQTAIISTTAPDPLVVLVTDAGGQPVPSQRVDFATWTDLSSWRGRSLNPLDESKHR